MNVFDFLILMALGLIPVVCLLVSPVFADPAPPAPRTNWFVYSEYALVAEGVAWFIGSTLLWRLLSKRQRQITMSETYEIMLLVMIVSFSIGLLFWIMFGWI